MKPVDIVTFPGIYAHMSAVQTATHTTDYRLHNMRAHRVRRTYDTITIVARSPLALFIQKPSWYIKIIFCALWTREKKSNKRNW